MSSSSSSKPNEIGVPLKLLQEQIDKKVVVDTATGEIYSGTLQSAEETMNLVLSDVKTVFPNGKEVEMNCVYVKGTKIRYIKLPHDSEDRVVSLMREFNRASRGGRGGRGGGRGGRGRGGGGGGRDRFGGGDRRRY